MPTLLMSMFSSTHMLNAETLDALVLMVVNFFIISTATGRRRSLFATHGRKTWPNSFSRGFLRYRFDEGPVSML